ncbi:MAG: hypothetical protein JXB10_03855 [Pirellulales bacterium]|nr:hypothetical protein [Pirellulales bacterium]
MKSAVALLALFAAAALTRADEDPRYTEHVQNLKKKLPGDGFTIVVTPPFVVVGDERPDRVRARAEDTVAWAVKKLKAAYFEKDPPEIIDIWLFRDKKSYEKNAEKLFGSKPHTPFGYCSHQHHALVMNIATGGGTLVHEIVHPFIAANFPRCPAWFNEGLASLYEQSGQERGAIHGYTNWRLAGLQKALREKRVPSFKTLCGTTTEEFYEKDKGTNYAQARYLCYYLQQRGLLRKYYHAFRKNCRKDPTGYETLQQVLGRRDMDRFQDEWSQFVLKLRFPER